MANVIGFVGVDDKALDGLELYLGDILKRSKEANSVRMRIDAKGNPIMESALTPYKSKGGKLCLSDNRSDNTVLCRTCFGSGYDEDESSGRDYYRNGS